MNLYLFSIHLKRKSVLATTCPEIQNKLPYQGLPVLWVAHNEASWRARTLGRWMVLQRAFKATRDITTGLIIIRTPALSLRATCELIIFSKPLVCNNWLVVGYFMNQWQVFINNLYLGKLSARFACKTHLGLRPQIDVCLSYRKIQLERRAYEKCVSQIGIHLVRGRQEIEKSCKQKKLWEISAY